MQWVGTKSILPEEKKPHHTLKQSYTPPAKKLGSKVNLNGKAPFKVLVKKKVVPEVPLGSPPPPDNKPVLIVYGPLRSANVRSGKLVVRRRRPSNNGVTLTGKFF